MTAMSVLLQQESGRSAEIVIARGQQGGGASRCSRSALSHLRYRRTVLTKNTCRLAMMLMMAQRRRMEYTKTS